MRIDALVLADGLHAESDTWIARIQMAGFAEFAHEACARKKILEVTHSSMPTVGYQSTMETANSLLGANSLPRRTVNATDEIGTQVSAADSGDFHLRRYTGESAIDHWRHLYAMHSLLAQVLTTLGRDAIHGGRLEVHPVDRKGCDVILPFHSQRWGRN